MNISNHKLFLSFSLLTLARVCSAAEDSGVFVLHPNHPLNYQPPIKFKEIAWNAWNGFLEGKKNVKFGDPACKMFLPQVKLNIYIA